MKLMQYLLLRHRKRTSLTFDCVVQAMSRNSAALSNAIQQLTGPGFSWPVKYAFVSTGAVWQVVLR